MYRNQDARHAQHLASHRYRLQLRDDLCFARLFLQDLLAEKENRSYWQDLSRIFHNIFARNDGGVGDDNAAGIKLPGSASFPSVPRCSKSYKEIRVTTIDGGVLFIWQTTRAMTCRKIYLAILMPKEAPAFGLRPWQIARTPVLSLSLSSNCISTKEKFARSVTCKNIPVFSRLIPFSLVASPLFPFFRLPARRAKRPRNYLQKVGESISRGNLFFFSFFLSLLESAISSVFQYAAFSIPTAFFHVSFVRRERVREDLCRFSSFFPPPFVRTKAWPSATEVQKVN